MTRANQILVVVDPTAGGRQPAVDRAALLARYLGASVELLLCDIKPPPGAPGLTPGVATPDSSPSRYQELLHTLSAPLHAQGIEVSVQVTSGESLHASILRHLSESSASLLVKDTHHHSFARRTFLRNTDWHLAHASPVPLLLTKRHEWGNTPVILAAIEPSHEEADAMPLDRKILKCAAALAGCTKGDLHLIHTYIPASLAAAVSAQPPNATPELAGRVQCETSFREGQIELLARQYSVPLARLHVETGTPETRLLDLVEKYGADVMVIGASSHGRWHRMIVGSTASSVLEFLPCDILIVRPDGDPTPEDPYVQGHK